MIIYVDGPEKAGKTTLVNEILEGFEPEKRHRIKNSGRDLESGFGYLRKFIAGLDSPEVYVWDRGWGSEVVYGKLLSEQYRQFAKDTFKCEWFYGRPMIGRGGRFILLPENKEILIDLREDDDLNVDPILEYEMFRKYATTWDYKIIRNNYTKERLIENSLKAKRSIFLDIHGLQIPSTAYLGPSKPIWTFVGETFQDWSFVNRPFYTKTACEYFRDFGHKAIKEFGYTSLEGFNIINQYPNLIKNIITVGNRAAYYFPDFPNVPYVKGSKEQGDIIRFTRAVAEIIEEAN